MTILTALPDWYRQTPAGRADEAKAQAERLANRRGWAADIAAADKAERKALEPLEAEAIALAKEIEALKARLADVNARVRTNKGRQQTVKATCERKRSVAQTNLRRTCSPLVLAFQEQLLEERDRLRTGTAGHGLDIVGETAFTEGRQVRVTTAPSRAARLTAVNMAGQEAQVDELRFEPDPAKVEQTLQAFWTGLPEEQFTQVAA